MGLLKARSEIFSSGFINPERSSIFLDNCGAWENDPWFPATNIKEDERSYLIELAVPGIKKEDIELEIENEILRVWSKARKRNKQLKFNYLRREYKTGDFIRSFSFPENANRDNILIKYENGILKINIEKSHLRKALPINQKR